MNGDSDMLESTDTAVTEAPAEVAAEEKPAPTPLDLPKPESKTFSQDDVDRIVQARLGRAQKEHEKALADMKATAELGEVEATRQKAEAAAAEAAELRAALQAEKVQTATVVAAVAAGVDPRQVDAIVKLADLSGVVADDGAIDAEAISKAVGVVVERFPGLAAVTPPVTDTTPAPVGGGPATAAAAKPEPASLSEAIRARLGA